MKWVKRIILILIILISAWGGYKFNDSPDKIADLEYSLFFAEIQTQALLEENLILWERLEELDSVTPDDLREISIILRDMADYIDEQLDTRFDGR